MRISVFGIGYVGAVASGCLAEMGHEVIGVDISSDKVAMLNRGESPIVEEEIDRIIAENVSRGRLSATTNVEDAIARTDVSFISVGTPNGPSGMLSMRAVEEVAASMGRAIGDKNSAHTVVMRSTVPPGNAEGCVIPWLERASGRSLGDGLAYYSNPEFLREGSSVRDFRKPPMTLIGAPAGDDALVLRELYAPIEAPVHVAPFRVAESVKFLSNAYHAVKLAFANEAGAVLAEHGVDARAAFALFREDRALNISAAYLRPGFAFGGSCLPKDVRSFLSLAEARHMKAPFLGSVLPSNQALIERAYGMVARHGRQKVALFGLAFKPGTDDLRESPFVLLAERLLGKGFDLCIFDRFVQTARLTGANRAFIEREIPHLERLMADDPRQAAEASRIVVIGHVAAEDRAALLAGLTDQVVIDLADTPAIREHGGIAYEGFCW